MNSQLLKAKFKKDKFFNSVKDCDSSDDSLSSDDESNLELEITGIILNNRYIAIDIIYTMLNSNLMNRFLGEILLQVQLF